MIRRLSITSITVALIVFLGTLGLVYAATNFSTFVSTRSGATQPLGASDWVAVYQGGTTVHIAGNQLLDLSSVQTPSNKVWSDSNNTFSISLTKSVTGVLPLGSGGLGLTAGNSGGVPCFPTASTIASSVTLTANAPVTGGGAGACPGVGTTTGSGTLFVTGAGLYTPGHGTIIDGGGHVVDNANAVFTNVAQTFTPQQTFGSIKGKIRTAAGTSDTLDVSTASTSDCGGTVLYTSTGTGTPSVITVTLPNSATVPCSIALEQGSTGRVVTVCATAGCGTGTGSTSPTNPQGFTGTFSGAGAVIGLFVDTNVGGTAAHYVLTGNGQ